ncbi:hypothetical protein CYMTET_33689 [Cymbomonas tetramitiformis]|uniref:Uncharacterized protein n=1 Tax=Cymbomonas tetramitiformis TaxID=36881 RepID=A0AAE0FCL6_9CHLO|nr:hypothetical protein CYMTET_33689 [Cymbomonas tetramitiformis]
MTEDQQVIDDTKHFPGYNFIYTDYPRLNQDIAEMIREGKIHPADEIHNALINLYMAVDSDYFVGSLGSSWARLVLAMSYGKYNCMQPHSVLGTRWESKWEFGVCTAKSFNAAVAHHTCTKHKAHRV